jgi:hypothetical protein
MSKKQGYYTRIHSDSPRDRNKTYKEQAFDAIKKHRDRVELVLEKLIEQGVLLEDIRMTSPRPIPIIDDPFCLITQIEWRSDTYIPLTPQGHECERN